MNFFSNIFFVLNIFYFIFFLLLQINNILFSISLACTILLYQSKTRERCVLLKVRENNTKMWCCAQGLYRFLGCDGGGAVSWYYYLFFIEYYEGGWNATERFGFEGDECMCDILHTVATRKCVLILLYFSWCSFFSQLFIYSSYLVWFYKNFFFAFDIGDKSVWKYFYSTKVYLYVWFGYFYAILIFYRVMDIVSNSLVNNLSYNNKKIGNRWNHFKVDV